MAAGAAMVARSSFLRCNSKFFIFPKILNTPFHLFRCNNTVFSHKPLKNPTLDTRTRCIQSTQISTKTENQDMGFVHRPNIVNILEERGLLESTTSENLRSVCSDPNSNPLKVYCGFDPTAESLHLGNLLGIIVLSWFQRCGHKVVALIGGATARIGDPSGKSIERPELDVETLEKNTKGIVGIISSILGRWDQKENLNVGFEDKPILNEGLDGMVLRYSGSFVILNNFDWWEDVKLLNFLRNVGRYARVGTMMAKESVKRRVESEQGMSYTEFTYQLLQGYDFVHLFENEGVNVQIGGSDQWGNITAGTELIRKILQVEGAYGLTFPLLLKSDGTKFGKSEDGAIWLSPLMLSPYKFYQYFFSVPDVDVVRFLKILTFLNMEEISGLEEEMKRPGYVPNSVQRRLAEEVTRFVHGQEGLSEALKATEALKPGTETKLDWKTIEGIAEDIPSCSLAYDQVLNASLVDLSVSTGLLDTKSAARRLLKQGGLYLNNSRVATEGRTIEAADIVDGKVLLLSAGKKNKMVIWSLSMDMSCLMILGKKYMKNDDDQIKFLSNLQEGMQLAAAPNMADYIPYIGALDLQGLGKRLRVVSKVFDDLFEKIIDEHIIEPDQGQHRGDFVDVMLSLMNSKDSEFQITRANIKAIMLDMLAGSMDTSSTAIEWAFAEFLRDPRAMKKVQQEIESVVGMDREVEEADLVKFQYLDMVVKESLRLHPVAPFLIPHESMEDCTVSGYHIPAKSRIMVNAWAIGRDPTVWPEPDKFFPERFIGSNIDLRGRDFELLPFGSGRRGCPGMQLGLTIVRLVVAQLAHCFDWELPNGMLPSELNMEEDFGLTMPRANHLSVTPMYRLTTPPGSEIM